MPNPPNTRSVKISDDERGGWSSDRPRRDGRPPRPPDISVRCRVLAPSDRIRYSPGSLLVLVSAVPGEGQTLAQRALESQGPLLSAAKVRELLSGRVPDEQLEDRSEELLQATVRRRMEAGDTVVIPATGLDSAEREPYARIAAGFRRPRHLILIEAARDRVDEESRPALNDLRRCLDAGELGNEGFQTAMRLGGSALVELKRIVFAPASADD